jgi:hypothetical protein
MESIRGRLGRVTQMGRENKMRRQEGQPGKKRGPSSIDLPRPLPRRCLSTQYITHLPSLAPANLSKAASNCPSNTLIRCS